MLINYSWFWIAVGAHVILKTPRPFKFSSDGHFNPIDPSGSDFPCKVPPGKELEADGPPTRMVIGEEQIMSFTGSAGGGSCQIALTKDLQPTKYSDFRVIHSVEGGCPARNQKGNLSGDSRTQDTYKYKIPEGIEPGRYIFSWTWNSRIGGLPEYYMNCAPIEVLSSNERMVIEGHHNSSLQLATTDFPPLFMSNMGQVSGGCTTEKALVAQLAITYPNPGKSVEHPEGTLNLYPQECDGNPRAKAPGSRLASTDDIASKPTMPSTLLNPLQRHTSRRDSTSISGVALVASSSMIIPASSSLESTRPASISMLAAEVPTSTLVPSISNTSMANLLSSSSKEAASIPNATPSSVGTRNESCVHGQYACYGNSYSICIGGSWTIKLPTPIGYNCTHGGDSISNFYA